MKRFLPFLVLALAAVWLLSTLRPPRNSGDFDVAGFGRLPVVSNGRVKPFDTVARTSLLLLQGRQRVSTPTAGEFVSSPTEWLLDAVFHPEKADTYPTFAIDNTELLALVGKTEDDLRINYDSKVRQTLAVLGFLPSRQRRFAYVDLQPHLKTIDDQAKLAQPVEPAHRSAFQKAVLQLHGNLIHYQRLKYSLVPPENPDFLQDLAQFQSGLEAGVAAVRAREAGQPHDAAAAQRTIELGLRFQAMSEMGMLLAVPPASHQDEAGNWKTPGTALLNTFQSGRVDPFVLTYAGLARTWRTGQAKEFNEIVRLYRAQLEKTQPETLRKTDAETRFNFAQPFYTSMQLYAFAFIAAIISWLKWPDVLGRSAFWLVLVAWIVATVGIGTRMWLEGRPPVTNLYSSALFVGWGAVGLCLILEAVYRNAVGSVAAGVIGFATLLIAHHLSLGGDTLEMMRAVLDSNFWLATHVVVVTAGYSATFLAGFLAIIYVLRGVFTRSLDRATADSLARMVYGIVCFATLFSFAGTVLGGIWADQSWGRFWGWDPKENGALIIVIWNAVILHARWGGMIRQRGLMNLAIFGNIVTSWSWFGTNMLGVGLHSYGFTDAAFVALSLFVLSQLALIGLASLPLEKWRSFRAVPAAAPREPEHVEVLP
ncbi:cytochrome c biogenesis protein [Opitutus terrae]|uniref:Cytochrome c assembly protein n=1 Tax=Opitutus terrae (strain DSM 11246 / JCM 15787 / PB90-1) TaxID=452637 RepID=B1ZX50_OPITP|nr:cytochrome c biogenesis protein CcsA [Opitutus terrae]ACB76102.1 cytochrome c assembly protein [Opitutus terrae PB90-1]